MTAAMRHRRIGTGLVAFGVAGLGLVLAAAVLVLASLGAIGDAASGFERQRTELLAMVEPAASALSDAADGATHAGASLTKASDASRRAADLTSRLAGSMDALAGLGSVDILGTRPFAGVTSQFTDVAAQSRALSADLASTADALSTNVADSQSAAVNLQSLADRLRQLESSAAASGRGGSSTLPIAAAEIVLLGLLAWFSVVAIGAIWLGLQIIRNRKISITWEG